MKIIVFQGGLGNQLFQYAFYRFMEQNGYKDSLRYIFVGNAHNGMEVDKYFETTLRPAGKLWNCLWWLSDKLLKRGYKVFTSYENDADPMVKLFVVGYWQNRRYLVSDFVHFAPLQIDARNHDVLEQIARCDSVSLHVRRGDYTLPYYHRIYGNICTLEYYQKAINTVCQQIPKARFFVFSDDIDWVRNNLPLEQAIYVEWNSGEKSVLDMFLMSHCKANIIANSSFSYWGAYLNVNENPLVVYPRKWFNSVFTAPDIFPERWVGL